VNIEDGRSAPASNDDVEAAGICSQIGSNPSKSSFSPGLGIICLRFTVFTVFTASLYSLLLGVPLFKRSMFSTVSRQDDAQRASSLHRGGVSGMSTMAFLFCCAWLFTHARKARILPEVKCHEQEWKTDGHG
jgi:hypothetical protein